MVTIEKEYLCYALLHKVSFLDLEAVVGFNIFHQAFDRSLCGSYLRGKDFYPAPQENISVFNTSTVYD